jgi:hypothetical protein
VLQSKVVADATPEIATTSTDIRPRRTKMFFNFPPNGDTTAPRRRTYLFLMEYSVGTRAESREFFLTLRLEMRPYVFIFQLFEPNEGSSEGMVGIKLLVL